MTTPESAVNPPTECWAQVGDLDIRYLDWGGAGHHIMALHGLASSAHWYDIVAPMLNGGCRIIAPDQRGHGQTTQATGGYDWETLAEDIIGLMDHLGVERTTVLGHSWGGNVAISLAARFPERVDRLVMIEGGYLGGRSSFAATWEEFSSRLRPRDVSGRREEFLDRLRTQLADCWSDQLEFIVQTMVYEDEEGQIRDILRPENHAQVMWSMWSEPPSSILPHIECPTLVVPAGPPPERAGSEFAIRKEQMVEAAVTAIKDCRVHWIPNTIHDIGYHKPQELARLIKEFLEE